VILITNDDGVGALGIDAITRTLRGLDNIVVFAPDGARSGMACAITSERPLTYRLLHKEKGLTIYSCTGTPVDCVKLAMNEVILEKPSLLVSGINHGGNHALSIHYSGTMGAAMEGCVFDIPSMGVSLLDYREGDSFEEACRIARIVALQTLSKGLPHGAYLNLNIPNIPKVKGIAIGRQTDGKWVHEFDKDEDVNGEPMFWISGYYQSAGPDYPDNDVALLDNGYASLVPCKIDVTDYALLNELKNWEL
jgi:5'-nucleotidase